MIDYGDRVKFPKPFRLDRLDNPSLKELIWRLSIDDLVIGYTHTSRKETDTSVVVSKLFAERAKTSAAWTGEPDALVRNRFGSLQAMFQYARDAEEFVERKDADHSGYLHMETLQGQKITGTTGHGHRILEKLREHDAKKAAS